MGGDETGPDMLSDRERVGAYIVGLAAVIAAVITLLCPPKTDRFPPQCASKACLTEVRDKPISLIGIFLISGSVFGLFGLNGRRIFTLEMPGGLKAGMAKPTEALEKALSGKPVEEEELEDSPPSDTQPTSEPATTVRISGIEYELYALSNVPIRVVRDALDNIEDLPSGTLSRIEFIARKAGKGNHPWLMKFFGTDTTWKISYGGQGKDGATVTPLE